MPSEPIKRNRYSEPPLTEGNFSGRNFDEDFNEFHLPLNRMQLSNFQEWGVAQGLEVNGSIGGTTLTIAPGVAVDLQGQLISLSPEGRGDIGSNPPSEEHEDVDVPVVLELSHFARAEDTIYVVTIQFSQILRFDEGPLGRYEDAPWIRLQLLDDFVEDGNSLVLARVTINSNGELTALQSQGRRLASKTVQELSLRRPQLLDEQVQQVDAGKIASTVNGLEITVPNTANEISLSQQNGDNFDKLSVNAKDSNFSGNLQVGETLVVTNGNVTISSDDKGIDFYDGAKIYKKLGSGLKIKPNLDAHGIEFTKADGNTSVMSLKNGNVGIGTTNPRTKLEVIGTIKATKLEGEGAVVTGMIMMWSGEVNNIPNGWALCDGRNGTPDLQDRFIVAAGTSHKPHNSGNPDTHSHTVNPPRMNLTIDHGGSHTHKFTSSWYKRNFRDGLGSSYSGIDTNGRDIKTESTQSSGSHNHGGRVDIPQFDSGSSSSSGLNRPKWYALCFIMKL